MDNRDSPYVERVMGTLRRECLDHVVVLGEAHLRRIIRSYVSYYQRTRSHLAPDKDAPELRAVQSPEDGDVIEIPEVGGSITGTCHSPPEPGKDRT